MPIDFLVVGAGLAGSVLTRTLLENGFSVRLADAPHQPSASAAAAGLFNPVTGRQLVNTWLADELFPYLATFYSRWQAELGVPCYFPQPIYRPFTNSAEAQQWASQLEGQPISYLALEQSLQLAGIHHPWGGLNTRAGGYVDVNLLLSAFKQWLTQRGWFLPLAVDYQKVAVRREAVIWEGVQYRHLVFCEGIYARHNPWFGWLPFGGVKGDLLTLKLTEGPPLDTLVNRGLYLIPQPDGSVKAGATYHREDFTWEPSLAGRTELEAGLAKLLLTPYQITAHQAGIRPTTRDRRPFVGRHPEQSNLAIFNGLGTKGVSLAPYFAQQLVNHLKDRQEIQPAATIERFYSLLKK